MVDSESGHHCGSFLSHARASRNVDHRAPLDGYSVHSQFKAVRTDPLPLHGALLSRDDRTGARLASGVISVDFYAWLSLVVLILGGSMIIWWATERAWGKFLRHDDSF
jgi:hypothetical protein